MRAALDNFDSLHTDKPLVLILGDMNELGAESKREHMALLERINTGRYRQILLCGPCLTALADSFPGGATGFADNAVLEEYLKAHSIHDTLNLLKGSHVIHI